MSARQLPQTDYLVLKASFRELVRLVGSETHAARLTRVSQQHLGRYGSVAEEQSEYFAPIDIIADLEAEVGPVVTRELARLTNHLIVALPPGAREVVDLGRVTGKAMKEAGEVFTGLGQSLDDGILSSVEGRDLVRDIDEAMVMLATLKLMVVERVRLDAEGPR